MLFDIMEQHFQIEGRTEGGRRQEFREAESLGRPCAAAKLLSRPAARRPAWCSPGPPTWASGSRHRWAGTGFAQVRSGGAFEDLVEGLAEHSPAALCAFLASARIAETSAMLGPCTCRLLSTFECRPLPRCPTSGSSLSDERAPGRRNHQQAFLRQHEGRSAGSASPNHRSLQRLGDRRDDGEDIVRAHKKSGSSPIMQLHSGPERGLDDNRTVTGPAPLVGVWVM